MFEKSIINLLVLFLLIFVKTFCIVKTMSVFVVRKEFKEAINDYLYLLEKGYSATSLLKLIGDRYRLIKEERSILLRGVTTKVISELRRKKLVKEKEVISKNIAIDYYNVAMTIISYLSGKIMYIATDGFLRDASESHSAIKDINSILQIKAINLMREYLKKIKIKNILLFLDSPVSNSGKLAKILKEQLKENFLIIDVKVVKSADYYLIHNSDAIVSTSDSNIIDKKEKIFDLAFYTLKFHYNPDFLNLSNFFKKRRKRD